MELFECSPQAKAKIKSDVDAFGLKLVDNVGKYPWDRMHIGRSFIVPFGTLNETHLRIMASDQNKKGEKKFAVIKHNDLKIFEVARVA